MAYVMRLGWGHPPHQFNIIESQLPVIFAEFLPPFALNRVVELCDQVLQALVGLLQRVQLAEHHRDNVTLRLGDGGQDGGRSGGHGESIAQNDIKCALFPPV